MNRIATLFAALAVTLGALATAAPAQAAGRWAPPPADTVGIVHVAGNRGVGFTTLGRDGGRQVYARERVQVRECLAGYDAQGCINAWEDFYSQLVVIRQAARPVPPCLGNDHRICA